jgi:hypothetical protein
VLHVDNARCTQCGAELGYLPERNTRTAPVPLEMAGSLGLNIAPRACQAGSLTSEVGFDPHASMAVRPPVGASVPLTVAFNNLSRSMGAADP